MQPLRVFIGWDSKEPAAFSVLADSILRRATVPVAIVPLSLRSLGNVWTRERGPTESTEFSLTRFLTPYLSGFEGYSIFMDCDMLCKVDIATVFDSLNPLSAVSVVKHDYTPKDGTKFLGQQQTTYPRKNWSSFMVFDNAKCKALTPENVHALTGLELHRFAWLRDEEIGSLPPEWNWLVGEYPKNADAKILHYTLGGPWFRGYEACDHAEDWYRQRELMLTGKAYE